MMNQKVMEWEDHDDGFQDSLDRLSLSSSAAVSIQLPSTPSDDDYDDGRLSFATAAAASPCLNGGLDGFDKFGSFGSMSEYQIWTDDPRSVKERRRDLLRGMGMFSSREMIRVSSSDSMDRPGSGPVKDESFVVDVERDQQDHSQPDLEVSSPDGNNVGNGQIIRSKSAIARFSGGLGEGNVENLGGICRLSAVCRNASAPAFYRYDCAETYYRWGREHAMDSYSSQESCTIKNLDTGREFVVNELKEDGTWNYLSDANTGQQLTVEEFERCMGYSPIVKELMRRESFVSGVTSCTGPKLGSTAVKSKNLLFNAKKKAAWLKNIKGVANSVSGLIADKDRFSNSFYAKTTNQDSPWTKVRQNGKSYKELTGLYMSQEIQAHQGSIWIIRFSLDGRYLASAGADKVIHVWQVLECETILSLPEDPHLNVCPSKASHRHVEPLSMKKNKKGNNSPSMKKCSIQDFIKVPKTIFSLSEKPMCSLQGHLDDVLDLSWSKSQQLLSSSMDKTVRLWDLKSRTCLKLFAHNDYVTCLQFNPADERYFISGSLDAKVRIWSIPDHKVVDWSDFHEMVTAACYTPDGQGALVGSHKGTCRFYDTSGCKLSQNSQINIYTKHKGRAKKITGFQFYPLNSSELMITSADSQIRVFDGTERIQKFRGFQNTSSQIAASFTPDGKYVVCASEDSQVYVWKYDESQIVNDNILNANGGKSKNQGTNKSHEHFFCKDVSVAIPWPGIIKYEPPNFSMKPRKCRNQSLSSRLSSDQQLITSEDTVTSSRSHLPPLPENDTDQQPDISEEFTPLPSRINSDIRENMSFDSTASSRIDGSSNNAPEESCSSSSSSSSSILSSRWLFSGNHTSSTSTITSTAWGLTLVTAGLGGEIRIYHNFGLPLRLQNQSFSLFGGLRQDAQVHVT